MNNVVIIQKWIINIGYKIITNINMLTGARDRARSRWLMLCRDTTLIRIHGRCIQTHIFTRDGFWCLNIINNYSAAGACNMPNNGLVSFNSTINNRKTGRYGLYGTMYNYTIT